MLDRREELARVDASCLAFGSCHFWFLVPSPTLPLVLRHPTPDPSPLSVPLVFNRWSAETFFCWADQKVIAAKPTVVFNCRSHKTGARLQVSKG